MVKLYWLDGVCPVPKYQPTTALLNAATMSGSPGFGLAPMCCCASDTGYQGGRHLAIGGPRTCLAELAGAEPLPGGEDAVRDRRDEERRPEVHGVAGQPGG